MFASRSKTLFALMASTFVTFALAAPASACEAPADSSKAASVDCKRAAQFEIFKRQLAMTDGGGNYLGTSDMPKECTTKG